MKMLVYRDAGGDVLPFTLDDLKLHIRVDHDLDDAAITNMGLTAAAEIEQFAQIALLTQTISMTIFNPGTENGLALPIGPVDEGNVPTVSIDGTPFTDFAFVGGIRPYIQWQAAYHDLTPSRINIEYHAGFGAAPADIPPDLAQALMDQAALHYDGRSPMSAKSLTTSPHMVHVGARYRGVQA